MPIQINDIAINSKLVTDKSLFICFKGNKFDGSAFVNEAIEKVKNRVFISDLAKDAGINPGTVRKRIFDGKILDEALDTRDLHYPYYGGIKATDICDKYGLKYKKVARRMHYYNWTFKQALISFLKDEPEKIKETEETVPETKD